MKTIKECWNDSSAEYFKGNEEVVKKVIENPLWAFPQPVAAMLKRKFDDLEGKRVLVPSSGDNAAVYAFYLMGAEVTSADISEQQLLNAKKAADSHGWEIPFICDDSMELSKFGDETFDLVYTSNGVHVWISDLPKMYNNFNRVLKPGGKYIMFETHPFIRPFGNDEIPALSVKKPYEQTGRSGDVPNFGWRIMDIFNAAIDSGFIITHMEEFHPQKTDHNLWFYRSSEEAEKDDYKKFDWKQNPWAVLPQWIGFSARK
jgi:SAM-dependent methyltransferase